MSDAESVLSALTRSYLLDAKRGVSFARAADAAIKAYREIRCYSKADVVLRFRDVCLPVQGDDTIESLWALYRGIEQFPLNRGFEECVA